MNRGIHGSVFAASLFISGLVFAQAIAPGAGPATAPPAQAAGDPAVKAENTPQQQKIADLIKQLAADDFATRDAASNELMKIGPEALPALKEALKSDDPSIQSYAEYLVPRIEGGRDGRRTRNFARGGGGQFGIAANRAGAADMLVARNGRVAINMTANNNVRTANITDGDRQVRIEEGPDGIRMSVTDNDGGKAVQKDYEAKSIEELRKEQPEAAQIYDKYMGRGRMMGIAGNPRVIRLTPPALDDNGLNNDLRRQIDDAQKLQDRAIQQQELRIRQLLDRQNLNGQDQQLEAMHRRLEVETQMLERRLAEVEALHKQLLEQTQAAQKRLAELEKQQQEKQKENQQETKERAR